MANKRSSPEPHEQTLCQIQFLRNALENLYAQGILPNSPVRYKTIRKALVRHHNIGEASLHGLAKELALINPQPANLLKHTCGDIVHLRARKGSQETSITQSKF